MTHTYRRRLSAVAAGCAAAGLGLAGAVVAAGPANSLPAPEDQDCPEAFPTSALVKGQPVDGLTVSSGNEADTFTGEVIGVLDDGIATGLDMILVRLTGAEIDRVGGIWAGMSGSPVYAADGRLIGAVSYGLSGGPSAVAGVTPAADMQELLDDPLPIDRALAKRVLLPKALQAQVAADPTTTQAEARSGFTQLALPVAVSTSLTGKRFNQLTKKLRKDNAIFYKTKSAPVSAAAGAESEIFAGSNLAAGISYGDFTAVGTGTTTMVCGDQVVGFGHPMDFTGPASLTLHGADALYVQEDSLGAPFKVANPGAPIGTINQDRMAGIKGILGTLPETTLVRTDVTYGNKNRVGDTYVSAPDYLSTVSLYSNFGAVNKVFDRTGKGTALIKYTIKGETAAGKPFTVNRTNRYADNFDITFAAIWDAAMDIDTVLLNDFTDVTIDDVT
ncbi:MAG: hypothetical protein HZY75_01825 [Nocardioidaceae bacterium]|nr:MAG: hypothetical protein HZY75_01825 [Nocardioidaceae bacterium]